MYICIDSLYCKSYARALTNYRRCYTQIYTEFAHGGPVEVRLSCKFKKQNTHLQLHPAPTLTLILTIALTSTPSLVRLIMAKLTLILTIALTVTITLTIALTVTITLTCTPSLLRWITAKLCSRSSRASDRLWTTARPARYSISLNPKQKP